MTYIAIRTDYAKIRKVRRALRRQGVEAYLPAIVHKRPRPKAGKIIHKRHVTPLMSYILARAPEHQAARDLWLHSIRETKDVRGYVTIQNEPAFIPERDIEAVKIAVEKLRLDLSAQKHKRWLRKGGKAVFKEGNGTWTGKIGTIQEIKKRGVELEMMLFGAKRIVTVQRDKLEAA